MSDEINPLSFVTTEELWDELKRRTKCCILAYTRFAEAPDEDDDLIASWSGGKVAALGLAEYMRGHIVAACIDASRAEGDL